MAKIIKGTKKEWTYSEDYRSGGSCTARTVTAYYCGACKKEIDSTSKFCKHCGCALKGVKEEI